MNWHKLGLIYAPKCKNWWSKKYAILPVPEYMESENRIRVYFGTTDMENFGRITYIELDADDPTKVLYEHDDFILDLGQDGTFDDCGVVPSSILHKNDESYLYTVGFQRCVKVPYMLFAGLAKSLRDKPETMERVSNAPILPRTAERFISQGAPCVIYDNGIYKMWHWFGTKWIELDGKPFIDYHIGYAESDDAVNWDMKPEACLTPLASKNEFAVARPWVLKINKVYHMWYSVRYVKKMYRIAYARSVDGITWDRVEDWHGVDVSKDGWDSEMVCYPAVLRVKDKLLMFYNGNNNGETGFGIAELNINELV